MVLFKKKSQIHWDTQSRFSGKRWKSTAVKDEEDQEEDWWTGEGQSDGNSWLKAKKINKPKLIYKSLKKMYGSADDWMNDSMNKWTRR